MRTEILTAKANQHFATTSSHVQNRSSMEEGKVMTRHKKSVGGGIGSGKNEIANDDLLTCTLHCHAAATDTNSETPYRGPCPAARTQSPPQYGSGWEGKGGDVGQLKPKWQQTKYSHLCCLSMCLHYHSTSTDTL